MDEIRLLRENLNHISNLLSETFSYVETVHGSRGLKDLIRHLNRECCGLSSKDLNTIGYNSEEYTILHEYVNNLKGE